MSSIILLGKFSLFFLSMSGYLLYFTQKYQIQIAFAPALFCAWTSNLLFAGGILNIMPQTVMVIFIGGYVLLVRALKQGMRLSKQDAVLFMGFLLGMISAAWLLRGAHFTSYDNFSHWATVVKDMLLEERMPNFADPIIRFQSYPLGSSLFIYYACQIIGDTDACFLWAQALMLLSFLFCMTAFLRKKNWYGMVPAAVFGIWALTVNNHIYELRVDTLLPLAGVAAFAVIYYYKNEPRRAVLCAAGLFMMLINIKNSGLFFYAVCALFLLVYIWDDFRQNRIFCINMILLSPLMMLYLWKRHVALVFADGMSAKHSMSFENFETIFARKTAEDIWQIIWEMLGRFCSPANVETGMMLFLTILFGIIFIRQMPNRQAVKKAAGIFTALWACFAAYLISLFGMYVFSMPLGEALHLASYDRYILSVLIFIYGITVIYILDQTADMKFSCNADRIKGYAANQAGMAIVLLLMCCPLWQVRSNWKDLIHKPDFTGTKRCSMQQMIRENHLEQGKSCYIYCNGTDDDVRYLFYLSRYEFWSSDILVVNEEKFDESKEKIPDYDYFIIWDTDNKIDSYLEQHQLTQYQGIERTVVTAQSGT